MYFWNINKLKQELKTESITEKSIFIYAYIYIVLSAAGAEMMLWLPEITGNVWDVTSSFSNIIIVAIGALFAFKANGGSSGKNFLAHYLSIGFVVTVRFLVLLIPIMAFVMSYYLYSFQEDEEIITSFGDVLPFLIWYVALYWRVCKHISDLRNS